MISQAGLAMRGKLVAGNWKMNGSLASNEVLLRALIPVISPLSAIQCVICAPFPYLAQVEQLLRGTGIDWGAQDVCQFGEGAYTGGVSGAMLAEFGCRYAIVGHSERRSVFGESDDVVAEKFAAAQKAGLIPILCLGESLSEREAGDTEQVVARQLEAVIRYAGAPALTRAVIAYEPVWAIGTGRTATPEQAQAVHAFIRERVAGHATEIAAKLSILYGGSVKAANAAQLFGMRDVDGGLIGGASLNADEFAAVCRCAAAA